MFVMSVKHLIIPWTKCAQSLMKHESLHFLVNKLHVCVYGQEVEATQLVSCFTLIQRLPTG
jgi:hypothetical protein